jgi:multiple sugar transport system permease protein
MGTGLFSFVRVWEEFLCALTIMGRNEMRTLPPGFVLTCAGESRYRWADLMAAALVISIPVASYTCPCSAILFSASRPGP